ncbi:MAG: DNA mismatch repair endonuclease MutL [Clostridia bacterium]|nr:DNA mismatch repair endonuclease MutL [Clostridia bacterium]
MKKIIVLEPNVANKIAAGEVVERPASIVKELLENSIDAGATAITVEIRGGGVDYIRITDNGAGIPAEDVPTAFLRHATSKLSTVEDLESIESFGFRGEALASIAAVSKVSMRTRTADADCGTHIVIEGGRQLLSEPCACPVGTTVEVNELFYNVPARLKFIKSVRQETAMINDYVSRIMLSDPHISIKLINNSKTLIHTTGSGDLANTVLSIYGDSVFASLYSVLYDDGYIRISGFVGGESIARNNRVQQSVFINRRYIKSMVISNAVQRAFLTRLMNHRYPFFVLDITLSSREVDVNVHPNKLSVRFRDEERVSNAVTRAVSDALSGPELSVVKGLDPLSGQMRPSGETKGESEDRPAFERPKQDVGDIESKVRDIFKNEVERTETESEADHRLKAASQLFDARPKREPAVLADSGAAPALSGPAPKPFPPLRPALDPQESFSGIPVYHPSRAESQKPAQPVIERPEQISLDTESSMIIGTAFDTYIIVQQGDSIYYIDQHAAHERILYEKLVSGKLKFDSQLLAIPMVVPLDPVSFACVAENLERFEEFGYSIDISNEPNLSVHAVPNLPDMRSDKFLRDAIDCVLANSKADEIDLIRRELITMSCKRAVKAGSRLDTAQLKELVRAYAEDGVPLTCPHGRPVMIRVKKTELQKMFKRII